VSKSDQIIKQYCGSIEERIASCCDEEVAVCLKQSLFSQIKKNCHSEIVLDFVEQYIDNLIKARFSSEKN